MGKRKATATPSVKNDDDDDNSDCEDYRTKRARNNEAVKKSREKTRQRESQNNERVNELRMENMELERQVETLKRELNLLKELFVECAAGGARTSNAGSGRIDNNAASTSSNNELDQFDLSSLDSSSLSFQEQIVTTSASTSRNQGTTSGRNVKKRK